MTHIVGVLLPLPFDEPFDYIAECDVKIGQYVTVPFGKNTQIGVVYALKETSDIEETVETYMISYEIVNIRSA